MKPIMIGILTAILAATMLASGAHQGEDAERLLKAAMNTELVDGNLKAAIEQYKKVAQSGNRVLAAQALVHMAECYQKLGDAQAQKIYEQVLRDYADQKEAVATARARLAALTPPGPSGMVARQVWAGPDVEVSGAPSPDGRHLSFVNWFTGGGNLAVRDLATGKNRDLTTKGTGEGAYASYSIWSRNSQEIAYTWWNKDRPELRVIALEASVPRVLFRNQGLEIQWLQPVAWTLDRQHVVALFTRVDSTNQIVRISVADGTVQVIKSLEWRYPLRLSLSPDDRYIVYDAPEKQDSAERDIFLLAMDGSREVPLVEHPANDFAPVWTPNGQAVLFASDRTGIVDAWVVEAPGERSRRTPELVKPGTGRLLPMGFTEKGSYYYGSSSQSKWDIYMASFDPILGKALSTPTRATPRFEGQNSSPAFSPDGKYLAFLSRPTFPSFGSLNIVIRSLATGEQRKISTLEVVESGSSGPIVWSPDGRSLVIPNGMDRSGRRGLYQIDIQSNDVTPIQYHQPDFRLKNPAWSPDGKALFYVHMRVTPTDNLAGNIMVRDLKTERETVVYRSPSYLGGMALSPDGRQLAFLEGDKDGRSALLRIMPATGGQPRELIRMPIGLVAYSDSPAWTADGQGLLFFRQSADSPQEQPKGELWRISVQGGEPQKLATLAAMETLRGLTVHPDGQRIAFTAGGRLIGEVWVLENFLPPLKTDK